MTLLSSLVLFFSKLSVTFNSFFLNLKNRLPCILTTQLSDNRPIGDSLKYNDFNIDIASSLQDNMHNFYFLFAYMYRAALKRRVQGGF